MPAPPSFIALNGKKGKVWDIRTQKSNRAAPQTAVAS